MRTFLIFLFVTVVSLFVYNPELDDFKAFLDKETQEATTPDQTSITDRMFNADTTTAEKPSAGFATERNNYLLFSTYNVTQVDDFREVEYGRYIGIATMFFQIGESEDMTAHAAEP